MNINLIGVPINYGCDRQGAEQGPATLRNNNIVNLIENTGYKVYDLGDLTIPKVSVGEKYTGHNHMKYLNPVIEINTNLAEQVYTSLKADNFPFIIGGDHSLGIGSIAGAARNFNELAVIWVDAHGDINTDKTSPSGNIHGMPLAASMDVGHPSLTNLYFEGQKVKPENVYIIGARDLDPGEVKLAKDLNLNLYTMDIVKEKGLEKVLDEVIIKVKGSNVDGVHLSFDIDVLDKSIVPGTGTAVSEGFQLEEGKVILTRLLGEGFVRSMDFVELNPLLDEEDGKTTKACLELIKHIFNVLVLR